MLNTCRRWLIYQLNPSIASIYGSLYAKEIILDARARKEESPNAPNDVIAMHVVYENWSKIQMGRTVDEAICALAHVIDKNEK